METTSKQFKDQVRSHIVYILADEEYLINEGLRSSDTLYRDQLKALRDDFRRVYEGDPTVRNEQKAFTRYLQGLPAFIHAEYRNYYINEIMEKWFKAVNNPELFETRYKDDTDRYYYLIYRELLIMLKKEGLINYSLLDQ